MSAIYNPRDAYSVHPDYLAPLSREDAFQQVLIDFSQALDTFFETDVMTFRLAGRISIRVEQLLAHTPEDEISKFLKPIKSHLHSLKRYGGTFNAAELASGRLLPLVEAQEKALKLIDPAKTDLLNLRERICTLAGTYFLSETHQRRDLFKWLNRIEVIITHNPSDHFSIVLMQRIDKIVNFCKKTISEDPVITKTSIPSRDDDAIVREIRAYAIARYREMDYITEPFYGMFVEGWIEQVEACGKSLREIEKLAPTLDVKRMQSQSITSLNNVKEELKAFDQKLLKKILGFSFPKYTHHEKSNRSIHAAAAPAAPPR